MARPTIPDWARRRSSAGVADPERATAPRVAIVGPCASGKSTLTAALQARGIDAHACAQEHSAVPHLWALSEPDILIYLSVDLPTLRRRRRDPSWPASIFAAQQRRLVHALAHCDVYIDTARRDSAGVLRVALAGIIAARAGFGQE
jgi:hypothetical protein